MPATRKPKSASARPTSAREVAGQGGETHQTARPDAAELTTNQGATISDNQNSLRIGDRGPTLLEDFVLREKITHFDHERIPERIVHARGSGAHGYFQVYRPLTKLTKAEFLQDPALKTPVFVRFSTVAGNAGSFDLARDVRGFAVKFYTATGNFDLVGNNMPVFFIQDAIKFPDLIHSVKMEPDRGFPQAASAHDTFWDFVSLMPESMHMLLWVMSDRAIPRSYRMMEGFGVHTFRLVNSEQRSTFVKFHWRPMLGAQSVLWDEAVKINGADPDFHRRDLWEAIALGAFPEFELSIQAFDQKAADGFGFDVLDPTKLIPEEVVPLQAVGKMVLDRNPDNFFAETEQVAFHPGHIVPGIDFSDDPLLQGRLHSYTDTQLSRLGTPNFHELPINRPKCPMHNFQRDGMMRMEVAKGRISYEPNSLQPDGPRESPSRGFVTYPAAATVNAEKVRLRSASFADHYSQARLFFRSMAEPEKQHIVSAFAFELGKVETISIRGRMLEHLTIVDPALAAGVADALGLEAVSPGAVGGGRSVVKPAVPPRDGKESPALSLIRKAKPTLTGRKVAMLVTDGVDGDAVARWRAAVEKEGARLVLVAPKIGGVEVGHRNGKVPRLSADQALSAAPSVLFDAVMVAGSKAGLDALCSEAAAVEWVRAAFGHLKVIGYVEEAKSLLALAGTSPDRGLIALPLSGGLAPFITAAKRGRVWERGARGA